MARYVALLRGINVGGRNPIKMADLRDRFDRAGFGDVATYIQSGNVVFDAKGPTASALSERIERMLAETFDYDASIVLRSRAQMRAIVQGAPEGFGADPSTFRSDVIYLKPPLTAKTAFAQLPTRDGIDRAWPGTGVLYVDRVAARASQSRISAIVGMPMYRSLTIRNWRTTTELLRLLG